MEGKEKILVKNKRAAFDFELLEEFQAGIQLTGTEVKSVRKGKASLQEAYCFFRKGELFIKNMHISEYTLGSIYNHDPTRTRKLLLKKRELHKLESKVKERGFTIVPVDLFLNGRGWAKVTIALGKGKKTRDKRQSIKEKDIKREMDKAIRKHYE